MNASYDGVTTQILRDHALDGEAMESRKKEIGNLMEAYLKTNQEFIQMLSERTDAEMVFDREVLFNLRKGMPIQGALTIAATKYPSEAMQWTTDTIGDIQAHYDYLKNHEDIMIKFTNLR
jgi:hypothetical protein